MITKLFKHKQPRDCMKFT